MVEAKEEKRIESRLEINTYLTRLKYALENNRVKLQFQQDRYVDTKREIKFTNRYTMADLFPDEDVVTVLKRELSTLEVSNYIETIKDKRFPKRSEMRVFGKIFSGKDVYIKIRVELMKSDAAGVDNFIFVMSFHYAEIPFVSTDFPYGTNRSDEI